MSADLRLNRRNEAERGRGKTARMVNGKGVMRVEAISQNLAVDRHTGGTHCDRLRLPNCFFARPPGPGSHLLTRLPKRTVGEVIGDILFLFGIAWLLTFWAVRESARAGLTLRLLAGFVATVCAAIVFLFIGMAGAFGPPDPTGYYARFYLTSIVMIWIAIFGIICRAWAA